MYECILYHYLQLKNEYKNSKTSIILCFLTIFSLTDKVEVVAADYCASTQNLEGKALLNELATISQKNHTK